MAHVGSSRFGGGMAWAPARLTPAWRVQTLVPHSFAGAVLRGGPTRRLAEAVTIDRMRKEIRRRRSTMEKLKGWRYALTLSVFAVCAVAWAVRRLRGRLGKSGALAASAAGAFGFVVAARRWELKTISTEELLKAFFPGPAAELFARLPQAIETLKGRLGADELYIAEKVDAFQIVRRLIELSCGQRKPYSEARALLDQQSSVSMEVEPEKLALGLQLLPFAEATYEVDDVVKEVCRERHQEVLILEGVSKPGSPAHFLCFNHEKKLAILSIRGTKTPADALTDLAGDIEERNLEDGKKLSAHSGFLTAADSVLARVKPVIRDLLAPLGYSLLVTGHSLGASTASLVTRLLRAEMASWGSEGISSVSCVAFAPCPCMDAKNASDCAKASEGGDAPMVLSFVCNDDAVPRISMQNLGRLSLLGKGASVEEVLQLALANRRRSSDQHVPGAVVVLHQTEEADSKKEGSLSKWTAWRGNAPDFPEMGYLELAPKGISHHMAPVYREALAVVAAARGVAVDVAPKADEVFEDWLGRYAACADEKA
ncbi:unnamed protein product [Durusdinium trenchii]|uniref:Diacylglycerol lipase-alpha (DAGL-alpha) (DGL-alpha) (Neural stem cell-derived dendrite regulator) (Sn1-specific diacylglycerol lipase alpha) n=2 Tax=Durusdinium trenchii TaxID=1381693 RepID=A0ABP0RVE5_9DINO